jgi:hypothetical protein
MREERNVHKILVGKAEGKRPLGRPKHRWEDRIRMDVTEIGWRGVGGVQSGSSLLRIGAGGGLL